MGIEPQVSVTGDPISPLGDIGKIVTVDITGTPGLDCDYTSIKDAAAFLKSLPGDIGGIIALRGNQVHPIDTVVDVSGLTIQNGRFTPNPTILAVTGGRLISNGTKYRGVIVSVPAAFAGTYLLDYNSNAVGDFLSCDLQPDTAKFILGNSSGAPKSLDITFRDCSQSLQNGEVVDSAALFTAPLFEVIGNNGGASLQFGTRPVIADLQGRYDTTGQITGLPAGELTVAPGENIQSRLNSLVVSGGGLCQVLPGLHITDTNIKILGSNITMSGIPGSIIQTVADGLWAGTKGARDGVIQIGNDATDVIANQCTIEGIYLQQKTVGPHGFACNGGMGNIYHQNTAEAQSDMRYNVTGWFWTGFFMSDSNYAAGRKLLMRYNRVQADGGTNNMYCDAYHIEGQAVGGNMGHGNLVYDAVCFLNSCNLNHQSTFIFTGVRGGGVFFNTCRNCPVDGNAIVIAPIGCEDVQFIGNSFEDCRVTYNVTSPAVFYIWGSARIIMTQNSINGVVSPTTQKFGAGFETVGYWTGDWHPYGCHYNIIAHNTIANCNYGINYETAQASVTPYGDIVNPNIFDPTVNIRIGDTFLATTYVGVTIYGTGNPSGVVSGNFGDVFLDSATSTVYKCISYPIGTTWVVI